MDEKLFYLATKAVIIYKGQVLLLRRSRLEIKSPSFWDFPGGRFKTGQPTTPTYLIRNLRREVAEETGIENLRISQLIYADLLHHNLPKSSTIGLVFFIYKCVLKAALKINLSPEHTAYKWFSPRQLPKSLVRYQKQAIFTVFN